MEKVGQIVRGLRTEAGLSQRSLAVRAGTTQAAVSRIERGLTSPTWDTVRALMLALGFEPQLQPRRLRGRYDPLHLRALRARPASERLEHALAANRLAIQLRERASDRPR